MLCSRVQSIFRGRGRKEKQMEISAPYDLKKSEKIVLPGISQDEISFLREKAVASRIGIVETLPPSSSSMNSWDARPYTRSSNRSATRSSTRSANRSPSRGW